MNDRSNQLENSLPVLGAGDAERPEDTKVRLHQQHKERGTLGVFDLLYGKSAGGGHDQTEQLRRDALEERSEGRRQTPARDNLDRSQSRDR